MCQLSSSLKISQGSIGNMHPENIIVQLVILVHLRIRQNINQLETKTVDQGIGKEAAIGIQPECGGVFPIVF